MSGQEQKKPKNAPPIAEENKAANTPPAGSTTEQAQATASSWAAEELSDAQLLAEAQGLAEQLAEEKQQLFQQHIRLQADFDNFRKRGRQEREELVKLANATLVLNLLPVLDNFERALNALPESGEREGVQMIYRQLQEALLAAGLTPIETVGQDFDPQIHEAVLQTAAGPENTGKVIGEAQKGYMLNGKLLRASMVQVGS